MYTDLDAELVFGTPAPPPEISRQPLQVPICLPQITGGYDSPFARAYNPHLAASGVEQDEFLKFLDALNVAMVRTSHDFKRSRSSISHLDRKPSTARG
jgi:hypothetical protein